VPFALAAIWLLQRTLHLPVVRKEDTKIDYLGAFLIVSGVSTLLIWSSLAGQKFEWWSGWTAGLVTLGVLLLVAAVRVEATAHDPIVPLSIFRNRTVSLTTIASALVGVAMFGGTVFLSQYFQLSLGKTPTQAGLLGLPLIFGLLISSTVAGQLITKFGRWKAFLVAGGVIMVGGMLLLSTITATTTVFMVSVHMFVLGVGVGLLMQNLVLAAQNDVPAKDLGATTSTLTFFRSLGGAIGVSALGAVLANKVAALAAEKFGPMGGTGGNEVPDLSVLPPAVKAVIAEIYATATAEIFLVGAPFAVLALLAVVFIKEKPLKEQSGDDRLAAELAAGH
jgi:Na+/melibiose symporter-like transporter